MTWEEALRTAEKCDDQFLLETVGQDGMRWLRLMLSVSVLWDTLRLLSGNETAGAVTVSLPRNSDIVVKLGSDGPFRRDRRNDESVS